MSVISWGPRSKGPPQKRTRTSPALKVAPELRVLPEGVFPPDATLSFTYVDACVGRDGDGNYALFDGGAEAVLLADVHSWKADAYAKLRVGRVKDSTEWGVFARGTIPEGQRVAEYAGIITPYDAGAPLGRYGMHISKDAMEAFFEDEEAGAGDGFVIDPQEYGNVARFFNHSDTPNMAKVLEQPKTISDGNTSVLYCRVMLVAARDIDVGEQLSFNYGNSYFDDGELVEDLGTRVQHE